MKDSQINWDLLAAWRFALASIVVVLHLQIVWQATFRGADTITRFGAGEAVLCFLLLSGFSIGHSIKERPQGFIKRRVWRIYPVYFTCLILSILPFVFWGPSQPTLGRYVMEAPSWFQIAVNLVIGQPLLTHAFRMFGPSWTLGVEWCFYLLAPLFLKASRLTLRWLMGISALLFTLLAAKYELSALTSPIPYLCLLWVWLLGFYIVRFTESNMVVFLMCAPLIIIPRFSHQPQGAFLWTFTVVLIYFGHKVRLSERMAAVARKLGDLSYSLYLVHVCAFTYCYQLFHSANPALMLLCALAMSMAVHYGVELPVKHLQRSVAKKGFRLSLAAPPFFQDRLADAKFFLSNCAALLYAFATELVKRPT